MSLQIAPRTRWRPVQRLYGPGGSWSRGLKLLAFCLFYLALTLIGVSYALYTLCGAVGISLRHAQHLPDRRITVAPIPAGESETPEPASYGAALLFSALPSSPETIIPA